MAEQISFYEINTILVMILMIMGIAVVLLLIQKRLTQIASRCDDLEATIYGKLEDYRIELRKEKSPDKRSEIRNRVATNDDKKIVDASDKRNGQKDFKQELSKQSTAARSTIGRYDLARTCIRKGLTSENIRKDCGLSDDEWYIMAAMQDVPLCEISRGLPSYSRPSNLPADSKITDALDVLAPADYPELSKVAKDPLKKTTVGQHAGGDFNQPYGSMTRRARLDEGVRDAICGYALSCPDHGVDRAYSKLKEAGYVIRRSDVRKIWKEAGLENKEKRIKALERAVMVNGSLLNDRQLELLWDYRRSAPS